MGASTGDRTARHTRRTFLRRVGAAGLGASAAAFGLPRAQQAQAYTIYCCHLSHPPSSYSACRSGCNYTWACYTGSKICYCCEKYNQFSCSGYVASAFKCGPI